MPQKKLNKTKQIFNLQTISFNIEKSLTLQEIIFKNPFLNIIIIITILSVYCLNKNRCKMTKTLNIYHYNNLLSL